MNNGQHLTSSDKLCLISANVWLYRREYFKPKDLEYIGMEVAEFMKH